jgi:hypothetical protein
MTFCKSRINRRLPMPLRFIDDNTCFDPFVFELEPEARYLWLHCIANPNQLPHGVFHASVEDLAFQTKIKPENLKHWLEEFEMKGKIRWYRKENKIWVKAFLKHQSKNPKMFQAIVNNLKKESEELVSEYIEYYTNLGFWAKYNLDIKEIMKRGNNLKPD